MNALAGTLTERVTIRVRGDARDDLGGASAAWADGATAWAAVTPDGFAEERARHAMTLRARPPAERVSWRGQDYRVRRIEADPALPDRVVWRVEAI